MNKDDFEKFKKDYLVRFQKTYRVKDINKKELKRSIYDNPFLTDNQKKEFWDLVLGK